jgi:hypothetical protein
LYIGVLGVLLVVTSALGIVVAEASWRPLPVAPAPPADTFMTSVATRDGALGWQQLCPSARAELPLAELIQAAEAVRIADASTGTQVSMQLISSRPRPEGGERRVYMATARRPGVEQLVQKTFVVRTQANGCVEGLE